jgi:quercetin dioxygenase-like cupin family protein
MTTVNPEGLEFSEAWIEGDGSARWRSAAALGPGTGASASGASVLEVEPGCRLARHTDSAEETIVVLDGTAELELGEQRRPLERTGVALVPANEPHSVRNAGDEPLRFAAVYASPDVVTTYEQPVQPGGDRERSPVA